MAIVLSILITAIKVIIAFSTLIIIHEFGHFIVAKLSGVWVEEFGIGLPPRIKGIKIGNTIYSINWLPIGGFVKLHGETSSDEITIPDKAFTRKKKITRIAITLAGIVMNFFLAIICFSVIYAFLGIPGKTHLVIESVSPKSPAETVGIKANDVIEKVNDKNIVTDAEFTNAIQVSKGKSTTLTLKRDSKDITFTVIPRVSPPAGEGSLGVEFTDVQESYFPPLWQRPFVALWYGTKETLSLSKAVIFGLGNIAKSVSVGQAPKGLVGFVGILSLFVEFAKLGILPIINLMGVVSINLAIINIIPFPPLDGSRIALILVEALTKKKLTAKMEERVYFIGFLILIGLTILITSHEIPSLIKAGGVGNYANSLLNSSGK